MTNPATIQIPYQSISCNLWDPFCIAAPASNWAKNVQNRFSKFIHIIPSEPSLQCHFICSEAGLMQAVISTSIEPDICSEAVFHDAVRRLTDTTGCSASQVYSSTDPLFVVGIVIPITTKIKTVQAIIDQMRKVLQELYLLNNED